MLPKEITLCCLLSICPLPFYHGELIESRVRSQQPVQGEGQVPCQEEWEKPAYGRLAYIAAELQPGRMGTRLCWHDTGCGAGSCPTPFISADSNLGGTASTFQAQPRCIVLFRSLAMSCAGRRLTSQREKMMAPLPEQFLDLVCQAVVYSVVLAQQGGCEVVLRPPQTASAPKKCKHGHRGDLMLTAPDISRVSESKPGTSLY